MRFFSTLLLACTLAACGDSSLVGHTTSPSGDIAPPPSGTMALRPAADPAEPTEIFTTPDPLCLAEYLGTTGQLQSLYSDPGLGQPSAIDGGAPAEPAVAATLPDFVYLRGNLESYNDTHYFAVREGNLYVKANRELTGVDESWRHVLQPSCLEGRATELSVDGAFLTALNTERWIYSLDTAVYGPLTTGWTRRWGPGFWVDLGEQIPTDVSAWAMSAFGGPDKYIDSAGREQAPAGIVTLYLLRSDGLRITYMDPWLPNDESREVCGPKRGTVALAGLSGSGSTVMAISRTGDIYTRLYEFDVSGANSVFLDYSWQDQDDISQPLIQLPAPDWIHHAPVPGRVTNRVSLRKLPPDTRHRVLRVEGQDAAGHIGFWEKKLTEATWRFTRTDEPLRGTLLPLAGATHYQPEDSSAYTGKIEGWDAEVLNFNPYCSPATLRLHIGSGAPTDLVLHSTDGLRQLRRARGLGAQPHIYRSAVEVPKALWNARDQQPAEVRDFIARNFGAQRFLTGPLSATPGNLKITMPCWNLHRSTDTADSLVPEIDLGIYLAEIRSAQEEDRSPGLCPPE